MRKFKKALTEQLGKVTTLEALILDYQYTVQEQQTLISNMREILNQKGKYPFDNLDNIATIDKIESIPLPPQTTSSQMTEPQQKVEIEISELAARDATPNTTCISPPQNQKEMTFTVTETESAPKNIEDKDTANVLSETSKQTEMNSMNDREKTAKICKFYTNSTCRFGNTCRNRHVRKRGLPNIEKNQCYMIAPTHMVAATAIPWKGKKQGTELKTLLKEVRKCLDGEKTKEEAEKLAGSITQYSKKKWPEYTSKNGRCEQEDAAEFLLKLITAEEDMANEVETTMTHTITCSNSKCSMTRQDLLNEHINIISDLKNGRKASLQQLANRLTFHEEPNVCAKCKSKVKETKEIIKAPEYLIIQVDRIPSNGMKINTEIKCPDGEVMIYECGKKLKYTAMGVIIHKGTAAQNGHYVYNHYIEAEHKWVQVDDDKISEEDQRQQNTDGTIYILKRQNVHNESAEVDRREKETMEKNKQSSLPINFTQTSTVFGEADNKSSTAESKSRENHSKDADKIQPPCNRSKRPTPKDKMENHPSPKTTEDHSLYEKSNTSKANTTRKNTPKNAEIQHLSNSTQNLTSINLPHGDGLAIESGTIPEPVELEKRTNEVAEPANIVKAPVKTRATAIIQTKQDKPNKTGTELWLGETIIYTNKTSSSVKESVNINADFKEGMDPKGKMTTIAADTYPLPDSNSGMRTIDDILQAWEYKNHFLNNTSPPQSKERYENKSQEIKRKAEANRYPSTRNYRLQNTNKRYYVDRDEPLYKKEICWWHRRGICKFGSKCWYSHEDEDLPPFQGEAQFTWAD